MFHHLRKWKK